VAASYGEGNVFLCPIDKLKPQQQQPRRHFDPVRLDELADSLREHGLLEPLVVRRKGAADELEIVAGERRWRAAQRAGLKELLVVVQDVSARDAFELALIENIQREDLNPMEFAEALQRLLLEHGYTQEALAKRVGKERSTIANALRLLRLPESVRSRVVNAELTEGHARALLGAEDDATLASLAERVIRGHLTVRQTEALVRATRSNPKGPRDPAHKTPATRDLETRLERKLGTRVQVRDREGKGEIVVSYSSLDELDRLLDILL
jgi:ParB family chromosome partitioning protein